MIEKINENIRGLAQRGLAPGGSWVSRQVKARRFLKKNKSKNFMLLALSVLKGQELRAAAAEENKKSVLLLFFKKEVLASAWN